MLDFEFSILDGIRESMTSPIMNKIMVFFTFLGNSGWIWILLTIILLCTKKYRKTGIMLAIGLLGSLIIANLILKPAVARLRPFQVREGIQLLVTAPHDYSFPSGHTMASVISATIILFNHRKVGCWILALAVVISFSRLYLYVHFPTDVLGGAILGVAVGVLSVKFVNKYFSDKQ